MSGKFYIVPEVVMVEILKIVNNMPYGQIAPLAEALGKIIKEQQEKEKKRNGKQEETNLTDEGT